MIPVRKCRDCGGTVVRQNIIDNSNRVGVVEECILCTRGDYISGYDSHEIIIREGYCNENVHPMYPENERITSLYGYKDIITCLACYEESKEFWGDETCLRGHPKVDHARLRISIKGQTFACRACLRGGTDEIRGTVKHGIDLDGTCVNDHEYREWGGWNKDGFKYCGKCLANQQEAGWAARLSIPRAGAINTYSNK